MKRWQRGSKAASQKCRTGSAAYSAPKRRQIAKDVMVELDIKKITAPDFTVSIRPGMPSLLVLDEAAVPSIYWQPVAPRPDRQGLLSELKEGGEIKGVTLSNPEPILSVRTR
jgi:Siphovirus Gp157